MKWFVFSGRRGSKTAELELRAMATANELGRAREEIASLRATNLGLERTVDEVAKHAGWLREQWCLSRERETQLEKELLETIRSVRAVNFPTSTDEDAIEQAPTVAESDRIAARRINNHQVRPPAQPVEAP